MPLWYTTDIMVKRKPTTIRFDEADDEAIERIRTRWGLDSNSAAIRFALRVVAWSERLEIVTKREAEVERREEGISSN